MLNLMNRRRNRRAPDGGPEPVRGDIGMAVPDDPEDGAYGQHEDSRPARAMAAEPDDGIPKSIPEEDRVLMRESRRAREYAREKNRRDDQMRQTVFSCACVVAGFCGIAGVVFGTAAVCRNLGSPHSIAASTPPQQSYVAGVDPSDMNVYYDQAGRMHVNVYLTKQPDMDINIRIDGEGNVTTETVPRDEGQVPQDPPAQEPATDTQEPAGGEDAVPDGNGQDPAAGAVQDTGDGDQTGGQKTEQELLDEQAARRQEGGSGYLESDAQYVVERGDTLTKVSHRTGFSVDFLAAYNGLADKNLIITGEVLRYPSFE